MMDRGRTSRAPGPNARRAALAKTGRVVFVLFVLGAPLFALACTCGRSGPPPEAGRDFGQYGAGPSDPWPYLVLARAVLEGKAPPPTPPVPSAPGRRVFLALWPATGPGDPMPLAATALGETLGDAVTAAARALASKAGGVKLADARIELDVADTVTGADVLQDAVVPQALVGVEGVLVARDDGACGFVLPGEVVERSLFKGGAKPALDHERIARVLEARAGVDDASLPAMRGYRFRAAASVESPAHDRALRVVRGMVEHPAEATPERLVEAVRGGADYLSRALDAQGRYTYMYHPTDERADRSYGWLRHAGATYALLEAYDELGTPLYLEKAKKALAHAIEHLHTEQQGKFLLDTNDEEQQKVGGAGLALVAFAKLASVTGNLESMGTMRALARLITDQQYEDGHFRANADIEAVDGAGTRRKREPVYYAGEAILGLLRLYAIEPNAAYLDAARRGADYVVRVRDASTTEDSQEHDHWISYAFNELYRVAPDPAYLEHAFKIARAIEKKLHRAEGAPWPDFVGTFYEGQTTPGATRLEAYDSDIVLSRFAGKPDGWLLDSARLVAASTLGQQYDAANAYWVKDPERAAGGVRESLFVSDVRIDYVQHAMSGWLHLARILRDPAYGKTGVPSQDPPMKRAAP
jgi:hypothetical protein